MTVSTDLRDAYRFHRQVYFHKFAFKGAFRTASRPAQSALAKAREDVAASKYRYPSSLFARSVVSWSIDRPGLAWIEEPAAVGLRFVGWADEIVQSISHRGWFTDEFESSTLRGGVWQLPSRDGRPVYVAGYVSSDTPEAAFVDLGGRVKGVKGGLGYRGGDHEAEARQAAREADGMAEEAAESEREYRAASNARMQYEELADEIATTRRDLLNVLAERRVAKSRDPEGFPALCRLIRYSARCGLRDIYNARKKRRELMADFAREPGWADY